MQFTDRTVMITGASGNLGRAVAEAFAGLGANLALLDVKRGALQDTQSRVFLETNLLDPESARAATEKALQRFGRIPTQIGSIAIDAIGILEAAWQRGFHRTQLHRVRARLQHRQDTRLAHLGAQAGDGGFDRSRVMRKVVVDGDAVDRAAHFHAPLYVAEFAQRGDAYLNRHAHVTRRSQHRQRPLQVAAATLQARQPEQPAQGSPGLVGGNQIARPQPRQPILVAQARRQGLQQAPPALLLGPAHHQLQQHLAIVLRAIRAPAQRARDLPQHAHAMVALLPLQLRERGLQRALRLTGGPEQRLQARAQRCRVRRVAQRDVDAPQGQARII